MLRLTRASRTHRGSPVWAPLDLALAAGTLTVVTGRRETATAAVQLLGLQALAHRRVGTLSAGERVRAALAAAVACRPALLCLDEPTAALDPHGTEDLVAVLDAVRADGGTVLVATHQVRSCSAKGSSGTGAHLLDARWPPGRGRRAPGGPDLAMSSVGRGRR
ncbi:ATP-binding cassette domain-containing protein [Blastococcus saxobsidens]|uniref:ATP-binding cassette domain-containing protein n=1 Tax=Blastococcus saxobsidens TaxID=138336 RepID=UPI001315143C|nr:ATP-binding cassette domain-containing protein [Blastococcus saxobsidens]